MTPVLARYKELVPYQSQHAENGIPRVVMEYLAAARVYPVVSPAGLVGSDPARGDCQTQCGRQRSREGRSLAKACV